MSARMMRQILVERARHVVVVTDSSKLGRVAFAQICRLDAVDELITDEGAQAETIRDLTEAGVTVTLA